MELGCAAGLCAVDWVSHFPGGEIVETLCGVRAFCEVASYARSLVMSVMLMEVLVDEQIQIDGNLSSSDRVRNIFSQFKLLDGRRQFMFREWLFNHSCTLNRAQGLQSGLHFCFD